MPSRRRLPALAVLCALSGCAADPGWTPPEHGFAPFWRAAGASSKGTSGAPVLLDNAEWWRGLGDPVLDALVARALSDSLTLAAAQERIHEAGAELRRIPGAASLSPALGLRVREGGGGFQPEARADLAWLFDLHGARRASLRAGAARVEIAEAEADAAQLLLLHGLIEAYLDLRHRQRLLTLGRQELQTSTRTLSLTEAQMAAEAGTRLDVTRAGARLAGIRARLPGLEAGVAGRINEISVLAGAAPGALPADLARALAAPAPQPRPRLSPQVGIPADLLRNRPDLRMAERQYYAAVAETGVARAALWPQLSLSGAISLTGGPRPAEYHFGPVLQLPALPGTARAGIEAQEARARQAHLHWQGTVREALAQVENALLDYRATSASVAAATESARLSAEAGRLMQEVFSRGEATLGDLIETEQALAEAETALADLQLRRGQSFAALNIRLGSGHAAGPRPTRTAAR